MFGFISLKECQTMNAQTQTNEGANNQVANEQTLTNSSFQTYGTEAVKAWQRGTKALGTGDQLAVFALAHAWEETSFLAVVTDRKGQIESQFSFDLEDYVTKPLTNENGTRDNKATNARTVAICKTVFGINAEDVDQSIKQRINRALEVVQYIMGAGFAASDLEISKSGRISVPYVCLNDEPDKDEASKNELKQWEAMKGETVELDGKKGHTIAELQRRARPKPDRHATANTPDKGAELMASITFVKETLSRLMDEKAKDDAPAPNKAMRKELFDLSTVLASYFDADPMDETEEEKKPETTGRKNTRASKG
jgi:hypothetical protein